MRLQESRFKIFAIIEDTDTPPRTRSVSLPFHAVTGIGHDMYITLELLKFQVKRQDAILSRIQYF